jgi:hypothetical protein
MKWSVVVAVVLAIAAAGGGAYYIIHQHEIRVEIPAGKASSTAAAREQMGTYKDAKHPSFPGTDKKE